MEVEQPPHQREDVEAPITMDVSLFEGQTAQGHPASNVTTIPSKFPPTSTSNEPKKEIHAFNSSNSVTLLTNATATSTISSMTSSTLRQPRYAGVAHGNIEPNEVPTGNEGRNIFDETTSEGNGPGRWLLNWSFEKLLGVRVADQLHSTLGTTVKLSTASVKGFKLHPHDLNPDLPVITSEKPEGNFPATGGAC